MQDLKKKKKIDNLSWILGLQSWGGCCFLASLSGPNCGGDKGWMRKEEGGGEDDTSVLRSDIEVSSNMINYIKSWQMIMKGEYNINLLKNNIKLHQLVYQW